MSALNNSAAVSPSPGNSTSLPSAFAPSASPSWWGANLSLNFNVKTTLIYIGASIGVLAVIMCLLALTMVFWVRPTRRRRLEALNRERHRLHTLREVKVEPDDFKPQLRAFPIVVLQPDESEVACGLKLSPDTFSEANQSSDIETGQLSMSSRAEQGESRAEPPQTLGTVGENGEQISYNPLTHYLTEREPHLFMAEWTREEQEKM